MKKKQHCKKCFNLKRGCETSKSLELDKLSRKVKFSCYKFEEKSFRPLMYRINSWLLARTTSEKETMCAVLAILLGRCF